jgi:hypothetical protein
VLAAHSAARRYSRCWLAWPRLVPPPADAVVAVVDAGDDVASGDMLVVGDRDGGDVAGHLWGEGSLPRRDEGIVGRLEMLWRRRRLGQRRKHRTDSGPNQAMQQAVPAPLAG